MSNPFFEHPILNSPYAYPSQHWELDDQGQPTQAIIAKRRRAEFITPIPKPRKQKGKGSQKDLLFDEGSGLSTDSQQYDHTAVINAVRQEVDKWRALPNPIDWRVGSVPMSGVNLDGGVAATVGLRKLEVAKPSPITERHHDDRGQDGID